MKSTNPLQSKHLHIVSFNVPYPANYGGVIDVFHKLKCLHKLGVKIHLHCFEYGREEAPELEYFCEQVNYYPRKKGFIYSLHYLPFIVFTRKSEALIQNLLQDDFPILLEGLHCCYLLKDARLQHRFKIFRESNIEHEYYFHLYKSESKFWQKIFYRLESIKLKYFEGTVRYAQLMLTVSQSDTAYFKTSYPLNRVEYLASFHPNDEVVSLTGMGEYILYHGNLAVAENYQAAAYIVKEIASGIRYPFVIAGLNPPLELVQLVSHYENVQLISNPSEQEMINLVKQAHINLLLTFQATGLKLKLLNVLYVGRFCLVNPAMLSGTGLNELCEIANEPLEFIAKIKTIFQQSFGPDEMEIRKSVLQKNYSNSKNAEKLLQLLET